MNKSVDQYLLKHPEWQDELLTIRGILVTLDLVEEIRWGAPVYTVDGKNVVGMGAFKSYFGLWFYQGALLKDKENVLVNAQEGKTRAMRQWRFQSIDEIDLGLVKRYIQEAITNQQQGWEIKPAKPIAAILPDELVATLQADSALETAFNKLTPYKQKEYAEYITEAKRAATKAGRLQKIMPMILDGIGLNDKYR